MSAPDRLERIRADWKNATGSIHRVDVMYLIAEIDHLTVELDAERRFRAADYEFGRRMIKRMDALTRAVIGVAGRFVKGDYTRKDLEAAVAAARDESATSPNTGSAL